LSEASADAVVRKVALLGAASVLAGLVIGGVGGRLVMRVSALADSEAAGLVTENGNTVGEITVGGTVALVVFVGGLGGMLASVVIVAAEPWLRWMGPLRGLGFGLAALAAFGSDDPFDSPDFLILDPPLLNVAMFVGLFVAFGFGAAGAYWVLDRRLPPARDEVQIEHALVASLGLLPLLMIVLFFTAPGFCGCDPAHGIGLAVLVMVVSTVITLAASTASGAAIVPVWLARAATVTGYGALAVLLTVGLNRTLDHILDIV
jgi:hypothetical protein